MTANVDLHDLTLPQLIRLLQLKSWLWLAAIGVAVFSGGVAFAALVGAQPEPSELAALKKELNDAGQKLAQEEMKSADLKSQLVNVKSGLEESMSANRQITESSNQTVAALAESRSEISRAGAALSELTSQNADLEDALSGAKADLAACVRIRGEIQADLGACASSLSGLTPSLWIIHQGDGNGYPSGNNGDVANHDDRSNWDSTHFKSEACPQNGGPKVESRYAGRICGDRPAVGPFGVLDVGGGTCGHGLYALACVTTD